MARVGSISYYHFLLHFSTEVENGQLEPIGLLGRRCLLEPLVTWTVRPYKAAANREFSWTRRHGHLTRSQPAVPSRCSSGYVLRGTKLNVDLKCSLTILPAFGVETLAVMVKEFILNGK